MKVAIFGGSFNPIHNAHINLAQRFVDELGIERVYFVPTYVTPLKDNSSVISAEHRLRMCEIALRDYNNFVVSDIELKRGGTSYSCDTIAYFKDEYPQCELYFIMGADMFLTLESWRNFKYIFENVTILTAPRDDCSYQTLCDKYSDYKKYPCKAYITKDYIEDLSSTFVRDLLSNNQDVSVYMNSDVVEYITHNNLYR